MASDKENGTAFESVKSVDSEFSNWFDDCWKEKGSMITCTLLIVMQVVQTLSITRPDSLLNRLMTSYSRTISLQNDLKYVRSNKCAILCTLE